ncbi:MAG: GDP-mannose 4,6-dehydratase, partial [Candidatus Omnitrophica bacterium]|nr:GDP-mannose 4,6-dehydratase [Candidatus Omnitrophota bacterium]
MLRRIRRAAAAMTEILIGKEQRMVGKPKKILMSGAAGFIGSEAVRQAVAAGYAVSVIDCLSYAGDRRRLADVQNKITFYKKSICSKRDVEAIIKTERPRAIIHFAAETHVDRSILGSDAFIQTNIVGTQVLLDAARAAGVERFVHVSTDEVYGDIEKGQFYETTPLNPSSPYSSSKAAADLLIKSYMRTFGFPGIIVRPSNNYGPWQYPEKFMPVIIYKASQNEKIPVYGKGINVREWLYVADCAAGILRALEKGRIGEI